MLEHMIDPPADREPAYVGDILAYCAEIRNSARSIDEERHDFDKVIDAVSVLEQCMRTPKCKE